MNLPKHNCELSLTHNEHKSYSQDLKYFIVNRHLHKYFDNGLAVEKAIQTDSIWVLQWYPDTPVGSHIIAAPTLEEVLKLAELVEKAEEQ